jgi:23S rRNA (guanosine2251-2'-O)-methyltransferase
MYWSKWYYSSKAGSAPVNGDTVKTQGAFNIPICKVEHIKDAIFLFAGKWN